MPLFVLHYLRRFHRFKGLVIIINTVLLRVVLIIVRDLLNFEHESRMMTTSHQTTKICMTTRRTSFTKRRIVLAADGESVTLMTLEAPKRDFGRVSVFRLPTDDEMDGVFPKPFPSRF
mmetsp:Transcript_65554/g.183293  ORF Transcript_65554/g.183293 Transcript_65554/m.183293 type:complete len:118 (-) Transcript_65554:651-1004(-)